MLVEGWEFAVEPMRLADVPAVLAIERVSFSSPWPVRAYHFEITRNHHSHYFVLRCGGDSDPGDNSGGKGAFARLRRILRPRSPGQLVGYGGFWTSGHRAHISTLAVSPSWRRRGLGLLIVLHMLDRAIALGMRTATLEVRVSNQAAQSLYEKCGFRRSGLQRGYYRDNGEDALLMSTPALTRPSFQGRLASLRGELRERLGHGPAEGNACAVE